MIRIYMRRLWLVVLLSAVSNVAVANDNGTSFKKPVLSIELGQLTFNGTPLPMDGMAETWEKALGESAQCEDKKEANNVCEWVNLGLSRRILANPKGIGADTGEGTLHVNLIPDPDPQGIWTEQIYPGTLFIDGAVVTPDSTIRSINRNKKIGPPLKERWRPDYFGYEIQQKNGIEIIVWITLTRSGKISRIYISHSGLFMQAGKKVNVKALPITDQQPISAKQIQPITSAEIQALLTDVQEASRKKYAGAFEQVISHDAEIRRGGRRETRNEFIKSTRLFFYSVTDYRYEQDIANTAIAPDGREAVINLTVREYYTKGNKKNAEHLSSQRWLLERVDGRVVVTELIIQ